ncbi:hypothetical protein SUGI_0387270 [Cryptomeria japonica]|uniref:protein DOG1-like 2 n=1 Tax=Cryptomeria japonica TaxID=3369 RepID=UPI002408E889|nr:protein DOG1-like 2 [Cryptomeria japonica]XP_057832618.1 protein DOG1-like 2 [Cryptomeria japonica]XP_059074669.1 protein DOG1-like 2 [Cryptomeria japonica]GLJ21165.1 hypothetical protein SUGI_0387270 [Cryptomeria japonica]
MLRRRQPPLLTLRPSPLLPPPLLLAPPPQSQQPPDLQSGKRSGGAFLYCKRFLQHYRIMKVKFRDCYEEWAENQILHAQTLQRVISADVDIKQAVERELQRYKTYYTVSMVPSKALHVSKIMMPAWKPPLENAVMWLGEWRPSALLSFVLLCHDTHAISLPPHHVGFVKELVRISHINERILDDELADCQVMSGSFPALFVGPAREEFVACVGKNLERMKSVVAKAQRVRFEAVEALVERLLTWKNAALFFVLLARFQHRFHGAAISRMSNLGDV